MNTMVGCPISDASQPKKSVRPVDANGILRSVGMSGCAYDGSEYQAYKAGVEYVRGLIEDATYTVLHSPCHLVADYSSSFTNFSPQYEQ